MNSDPNSFQTPPSLGDLLDFAEGRLSGEKHRRLSEYVASLPGYAQGDWEWVQHFLRDSRAVDLHPVPADLQEKLRGLYTIQPAPSPLETMSEWIAGVRRVVAELVEMGAPPDFAAAGLRSQSFAETTRQWVFKAEPFEIWINALGRPDQRFDLHGQLVPTAAEAEEESVALSVQLVQDEVEAGFTVVDAYGEFVLEGVAPGSYAVIITGEDIEITCGAVNLEK